jgi:FAD:protein FMN transferase
MIWSCHSFYAMGSDCAVHLVAENASDLETFAQAAEAEVVRIERRYSSYRADSELTKINAAAASGNSVSIDDETEALVNYAKACFAKSDGAFDITSGVLRLAWDFSNSRLPSQTSIGTLLPRIGLDKVSVSGGCLHFARPGMELDFGGLDKEYAADRAAEACAGLGAKHGFVDLAGDIRIIGPQPGGLPWMIGIRHPRNPDLVIAEVAMSAGALATSGDYERFIELDRRRYCHILDPRTGWPARGLSSVTVISERCLVAGSLSTIAMLKGRDGADWLRQLNIRHIVISEDGECQGTEPIEFKRCS